MRGACFCSEAPSRGCSLEPLVLPPNLAAGLVGSTHTGFHPAALQPPHKHRTVNMDRSSGKWACSLRSLDGQFFQTEPKWLPKKMRDVDGAGFVQEKAGLPERKWPCCS